MTPTLRAELDRIEDFLMGPEGEDLAYVLSALRGPDEEDIQLKRRTTNHIRRAAFPRLAAQFDKGSTAGATDVWDMWVFGPFTPTLNNLYTHFLGHIHTAARVLGLLR